MNFSTYVRMNSRHHLQVEECDVVDLVDRFDTPLYIVSEGQLRHNFHRMHKAFASRYPGQVQVLFSNKSNFGPAVSRILSQEGAGSECYTEGELYLSLIGGMNPNLIVLHDSNKAPEYLKMGLDAGAIVALDTLQELDEVSHLSKMLAKPTRILIRLRLILNELDKFPNQWSPTEKIGEAVRAYKLGAHWEEAREICNRALHSEWTKLLGLHFHIGRWGNEPKYHCTMLEELIDWTARFREETGWEAECLNVGGGFTHGRPEGAGPDNADKHVAPIEVFAEEIVNTLKQKLNSHRLATPILQLEPGRYLTENAGIFVARVGTVREWPGRMKWVLVDAFGQHLPRVESHRWYYHAVVANKVDCQPEETVQLAGRGCGFELLGACRHLPRIEKGDLIGFLDTGAYTETKAANMNAAPRPATLLVSGHDADIITTRERLSDVAGRFQIPARLLKQRAGASTRSDSRPLVENRKS
ncbi:MAG TPA: hypothetical protein VGL91_01660 [Acidobacteriota bacterium]|jgi:diaminopimelate decarboxylase